MLNNGVNLWRLLLDGGSGYPILNLVQLLNTVSDTEFVDAIDGNNATIKASNCLTFDGVDDKITFTDLSGVSIVSSDGTSTPSINGNDIECTAGTLYNLVLDNGSHYPLAEGGDNNAYDTVNDDTGVISSTGDVQDMWTTQDDYHYNITQGFNFYG